MNSHGAKTESQQSSSVILSEDLIGEILSLLNVKSLIKFKCVCKSWYTLISDPIFIKLHLKKSSRNKHITLVYDYVRIVRLPLRRLVKNTFITFVEDPYFHEPCFHVDPYFHESSFPQLRHLEIVGSCNGLLCLNCYVNTSHYEEVFLYLWNPATKTLSNKIMFIRDEFHMSLHGYWSFWFGYHNSTDKYKIVAFCRSINEVRVFNLGDDVWRNIQSFPVVPFNIHQHYTHLGINDGLYISGAINWLAIRDEHPCNYHLDSITTDQFVIISLDLSTETYSQFSPPPDFDKVQYIEPTLAMLMDYLCFSHDFHGTHFIIWQMKEFGVEKSWTQFLKISYYQNLQFNYNERVLLYPLFLYPLCLSENGDTLLFAWDERNSAFLYNLRDNTGEETRISNPIQWWFCAKNYVESLVSTS